MKGARIVEVIFDDYDREVVGRLVVNSDEEMEDIKSKVREIDPEETFYVAERSLDSMDNIIEHIKYVIGGENAD